MIVEHSVDIERMIFLPMSGYLSVQTVLVYSNILTNLPLSEEKIFFTDYLMLRPTDRLLASLSHCTLLI